MMELIARIDQKRIDAAARQEELNIED